MLTTLAVENFRSLNQLVMPLAPLTVVTGANGAGKSNLYGALRLLSAAANGQVVSALAKQGGLSQVMWAGPAKISRAMERGEVPAVQAKGQRAFGSDFPAMTLPTA
jgi:predicted ATPase